MSQLLKIPEQNSDKTVYERAGYAAGYKLIAGCDEAGRGPLAGPIIAACVILPREEIIEEVDDSKRLSPQKREKVYDLIVNKAVGIGIGRVDPEIIDSINIKEANYLAMKEAVNKLPCQPDLLLTDYFLIPGIDLPQQNITRGDSQSISIGAASIVAKVTRDRLMIEYDAEYPHWGFAKNKGYGTAFHIEILRKYGPCKLHRRSFIRKFFQ